MKPQESKRLASTREMCRKQSTRLLTHPMKRIGRSRRHLSEVQKPKSPQTIWSEHAEVLKNPSYVSSNILYALESQKPRNMAARSIAFPTVNVHALWQPPIAEACRALSSLSIDNNYLRPGVTPPVEEESCLPSELCSTCPHGIKLKRELCETLHELLDHDTDLSPAHREQLLQKRSRLEKQIEQLKNHIRDKDRQNSQVLSSTTTPPKSHTDFRSLSSDQGRYACDSWNMRIKLKSELCETLHELLDHDTDLSPAHREQLLQKRSRLEKQIEQLKNHIGDKDRQNSQVLSSTTTPPKSHTDFRSLSSDQGRYACDSWNMRIKLKSELCETLHELLDHDTDLSPAHREQLLQKRSRLEKQIEQLKNHIRDKDRQNSQVLSSTTTPPKSHTDFRSLSSDQGRYACDSWNMRIKLKSELCETLHELLDHDTDLSPAHREQLLQKRSRLEKQIEQLKNLIRDKDTSFSGENYGLHLLKIS